MRALRWGRSRAGFSRGRRRVRSALFFGVMEPCTGPVDAQVGRVGFGKWRRVFWHPAKLFVVSRVRLSEIGKNL